MTSSPRACRSISPPWSAASARPTTERPRGATPTRSGGRRSRAAAPRPRRRGRSRDPRPRRDPAGGDRARRGRLRQRRGGPLGPAGPGRRRRPGLRRYPAGRSDGRPAARPCRGDAVAPGAAGGHLRPRPAASRPAGTKPSSSPSPGAPSTCWSRPSAPPPSRLRRCSDGPPPRSAADRSSGRPGCRAERAAWPGRRGASGPCSPCIAGGSSIGASPEPVELPILSVRHRTVYRYRRPVAFGEHRIMFRPRDSYDQRLIEATLDITPEPATPALDVRRLRELRGGDDLRDPRGDAHLRLRHHPRTHAGARAGLPARPPRDPLSVRLRRRGHAGPRPLDRAAMAAIRATRSMPGRAASCRRRAASRRRSCWLP